MHHSDVTDMHYSDVAMLQTDVLILILYIFTKLRKRKKEDSRDFLI